MDPEKGFSQPYVSGLNSKPDSIQSQPSLSSTKKLGIGQKNGRSSSENDNDASENGGNESDRATDNPWHNFAFLAWWFLGACILVIPLALTGTVFRTAHIKDVRLFGFFFWLAISWCSLLASYMISWALGYFWFQCCQHGWRWFFSDDYETFMVDIRHSIMFFLWAIASWAMVPLLCILDHHHCTDHWVAVLHKVLLVTFLCAFAFLVKSFLLEQLFIKTAMETMTHRQGDLEKLFYAIVILLPISDEHRNMHNRYEWVKAMRTWSAPKITIDDDLEQDDSDSSQTSLPTSLPTVLPPIQPATKEAQTKAAQYVANIFQGEGCEKAYKALRSAIEGNTYLHKEDRQDDITQQPIRGLNKDDVKEYLQAKYAEKCCNKRNKDFLLALRHFKDKDNENDKNKAKDKAKNKAKDDVWTILQDSKDTEFVSLDDLYWLIKYLGECLKEAVQGQKNIKSVVNSLDVRLTIFLCIPVAIIYVAIFTKNFATNFAPLWTAFFGISFAIQDPVKEFVSACVFVFAQHAYDKNDLVVLDEDKDVKLVVKKIYLMHTSFEPVEGGKDIHIPHSKLSSDCIQNLSRLAQKLKGGDPISVILRFDPKLERLIVDDPKSERRDDDKIEAALEGIQKDVDTYVLHLKNPNHFYESPTLNLISVKDEDLFSSGIEVEFKVKRKNAGYAYKDNKKFRNDLLQFIRRKLRDKGFRGLFPKEASSQSDQDTKQGNTGYEVGS